MKKRDAALPPIDVSLLSDIKLSKQEKEKSFVVAIPAQNFLDDEASLSDDAELLSRISYYSSQENVH
jgi:hypothetical protein